MALAVAFAVVGGCGGDDAAPVESDAGAGTGASGGVGGTGGTGGLGGVGGTGGNSVDAGGSGSDAGGTGGSDAAVGRDASIDDVDLTLGGLNQDLPAPTFDCFARESYLIGCVAVSGEYNGEPFEYSCTGGDAMAGFGGVHVFGCDRNPRIDGYRSVELLLSRQLLTMPAVTFSVDAPTAQAFAGFWNTERNFKHYENRNIAMNLLADTHDESFGAAGLSAMVQTGTGVSARTQWRVDGTFALSLTPKDTCVPDSMGFGCDAVRLRAQFRVFPNVQFQ